MLQSRHAPVADEFALAPSVSLTRARAHEVTGAARATFAVLTAAGLAGPVLWLQPGWQAERPMGDGLRHFLDPARLVFGRGRTTKDLLWAAEEALRTGLVPLVVAATPEVPSLTAVRRLHLAAETGASRGAAPIALLLTPGRGGAPGVETRWEMTPAPGWARGGGPRWRLLRLRARMAPEAAWDASFEGGRLRLAPAPVPAA
jgi:protein ImuA